MAAPRRKDRRKFCAALASTSESVGATDPRDDGHRASSARAENGAVAHVDRARVRGRRHHRPRPHQDASGIGRRARLWSAQDVHNRSRQADGCARGAQPRLVGVRARGAEDAAREDRKSCAAWPSSRTGTDSRAPSKWSPPTYDAFLEADMRLLRLAKTHLARIPFDELDLLVVDELGKTMSGAGMDPNVIGLWRNSDAPHHPDYRRIVVLSLTYPSLGNGLGIGMADFTTRRFADAYDPSVSYINLLTASEPGGNTREGPLPLALDSDREAMEVGLFSSLPGAAPRVCRIKNTALLDEFWVSEALLDEVKPQPESRDLLDPPAPLPFDRERKPVVRGSSHGDNRNRAITLIRITTKTPPTRIDDGLQTGTTATAHRRRGGARARTPSRSKGEVRFGDGDRGMYASDAGNYRMVPIGVVLPEDADDVLHTLAACRRHGAPIVARGGGTGIPGQTVNVAVLLDFSKYMNRIVEMNPDAAVCARAAGHRARRAAQRGGQARADLRSRSGHAQPQHARRDDRQQLLRHSLDDGGRDGGQHRRARHRSLRRHTHDGGRDERRGTGAHHPRGRAQRRNLPAAQRSPRQICGPDSQGVPDDPAAGLRFQPAGAAARSRASTSRRPWSAPSARACSCWRRRRSWSTTRRCARCWCSAIPISLPPPTTSSSRRNSSPIGSGGARRHLHRVHEEEGAASAQHELHAGGQGVAADRVRRQGQSGSGRECPASAWTTSSSAAIRRR